MGKHELKNKKDEGKWNWALLAANVLLTLCFAAVFWPILHKGSLSFLDKTSNLLALAAFLPLVLRPWKKAPAPLALIHDLLLLGSASAVSVVTVEYMVKGGSVGLEQSFWQGWLCYIGLYAAAYLITARGRLAVCVGMGISLLHGLIDHYVMLFRGTPVMLSDVFSIGTAANVAQGYSAPVELSVLRGVSTAVLYCVLVCLMQRRWKLFERWYVRRGCSLIVVALAASRARASISGRRAAPTASSTTSCAAQGGRLCARRRGTAQTDCKRSRRTIRVSRGRKPRTLSLS